MEMIRSSEADTEKLTLQVGGKEGEGEGIGGCADICESRLFDYARVLCEREKYKIGYGIELVV